MPEKRLNNTIFLMYAVASAYSRAHAITNRQFLDLDRQYGILGYIAECPDVFDPMTDDEMVAEVDAYVRGA